MAARQNATQGLGGSKDSKGSNRHGGHQARKRFGQNFLVDEHIIDQIVQCIAPAEQDHLIEIGPGLGALTNALLARLPRLTAIELDRDLVSHLRKAYSPERLTLIEADVLKADWASILATQAQRFRVVGNLPYNISSPLLVMLIAYRGQIADQHFMLQREVVDRIVAGPGASSGRLGLLLQAFYRCEKVLDVPPEAFKPAPKVQSAIVRMLTRDQPAVADAKGLSELLHVGFSQRRKMIRRTVLPWLSVRGVMATEIDPTLRPEQVPAEVWYSWANQLATH
ncbi:MAG: 16S rRNA (adenine(1518)-N(6)/adenine(1519)-N(6))-dimethyltransferase RsmA [Burkholderiaceae bacterium]